MRPFALRLAVALLTFAFGVAIAAPWYANHTEEIEVRVAPEAPRIVAAPQVVPRLAEVRGGMLDYKAVSKPVPAYPAEAKAARAEGTVVVEIKVDEMGRVEAANAVSGHPLLRQASVEAALKTRFSPTLLSGQPIKVSGFVTYKFVLS
jgi:protein TonB